MKWDDIFGLTVSPLELIVRGSVMYLFLFLLFRVVVRRRVGSIGMADILILVIIADAAQNGMAGDSRSVTDAFILVGTLVAWNMLTDWLVFRIPTLRSLLETPRPHAPPPQGPGSRAVANPPARVPVGERASVEAARARSRGAARSREGVS